MPRTRRSTRAGLALLAAAAVYISVTGVPAQAVSSAGLASVSGTKVQYKSARGKQSAVVLTRSGNTVTIDDRVAIKIGKGCKAVKGDKTKAKCRTSAAPTRVRVWTYDRKDSIVNRTGLGMTAYAGTGNDKVTGGPRGDYLYGDEGNDKIYGLAGDDHIFGDEGNDTLYGGDGRDEILDGSGTDVIRGGNGNDWFGGYSGNDKWYGEAGGDVFSPMQPYGKKEWAADADYFSGGSGRDGVDYRGYSKAVSLDLDGVKGDDGAKGEKDTIAADVEDLAGGSGNDRLIGNGAGNWLDGGDGNDVMYGHGGVDDLTGFGGADKMYGGAGDDWLDGREDGDRDTVTDLFDGGAHDEFGDSCVVKTGARTTGCENFYPSF
ncbi:Ca2+-binding RTX toxin-like protein [Actinoplanes lutulentus]|uniref:Hemolysin type calcium-binding protein n=1 Tax=Actinoplanes lutulentus TaxID=1287878 RepID=A0A327ZLQ4_9ACTN|nr:calcium-binding protein [Actinoplanes lutulentus]MBB2947952.1 Ca2+-binding RTX toxin-like protein [Actinoplanes lutulentus]RAK40167.1 hemolysin type calcium-binding protein [Actinoplanes lutulentus]